MPKILVTITREENCQVFNCKINDTVSVDFQEYIGTVVASEMGDAPLQACKAQAVAARGLALSRGVFRGKAISDSSSVAQAYRAKRYDESKFPNAIKGTRETQGEVLTYKGKLAVTHYSANNGGRTTSSEQRWGGHYDYLIAQDDIWDAATGKQKYGHGVGMSQLGASYAAKYGKNYKEILAFYYPNCVLKDNYNGLKPWQVVHVNKEVILNQKAKKIIELAKEHIGCQYVFGALGEKKNGARVFDCRGFTYWLLKQVGILISTVGATTQYRTSSDWVRQGKVGQMPNIVCPVFKYRASDGKMSHTGMHIGNGVILHCTTNGGVKYGNLSDTSWSHFAIPKGLYSDQELKQAGQVILMITLKKGSSGSSVSKLQQILKQRGYLTGNVDGKFGGETEKAVISFQQENDLSADGIVGAQTWSKLQNAIVQQPKETIVSDSKDTITISAEDGRILYQILKKYYA